jgi:transposase-like protein
MAANDSPKTLQDAIIHFSDLDVCQKALVEARWPDGVTCPTCGRTDVAYLANQRRWQCKGKHPKRQFSAKVGTIFEDSPISLSKWFVAIWLIASAKNGISSYELHRAIGVTQKTAWFLLHRIRLAMQTGSFEKKFEGHVEADETFIGGRARYMHKDRRQRVFGNAKTGRMGKVAVMGLLERNSREKHSMVRTLVVPNVRRPKLQLEIRKNVTMDGSATVYTDALKSYEVPAKWGRQDEYIHKVIDHAEAYVDGVVHTNGMENYWSLLKRTIKGTYVSIEPFHLFRYLDEQALRFNTRKMTDGDRFAQMTRRVIGKRLTYADLTGKPQEQSA